MAQVESCPERAVLDRLVRGQLAGTAGERLAQHLESCDRCAGVAHGLALDDTLVEAARALSTSIDGPEAAPLRRLVERLQRLGPPAISEGPTTSGETPSNDDPAVAQGARADFLAPPAGPGEIGRLGRYRILKQLGAGGMGIVFQAEDPRLKRTVALKVLKPEAAEKARARARFLREAQSAAGLEHEHIVTIFEVSDEGAVPYLAMQCLSGVSLEERLRRSGPFTVPQVLRLGRQIARGLAAAHEHGLIHRDIKPANLWLEPEHGGHVKILDFGLARAAEDEEHLTQYGTLLGTPAYMAPEQARGEAVDARSDLFSLGVVLYRLTSGRLPFRGEGTMAVLTALATQTPTPLGDVCRGVPPALAELVMQLLAKDPAQRPQSAAEVASRLHAIERATSPAPDSTATEVVSHVAVPIAMPVAASAPPARRRRRWPYVAAAILVALMPLAYFFGGAVIRIATNRGQLVIEVNDPQVEVTVREKGAVIQDRPGQRVITLAAGEHEVDVAITDAIGKARFFTRKLTIERGGKVIVNAWEELAQARPKAAPVAKGDPDRRAAEWVLSVGGGVAIAPWQSIYNVKELPAGPFRVESVDLRGQRGVDDAALERFKHLESLRDLNLMLTQVTDAGLDSIKDLANLQSLSLHGTRITDNGLALLKELPKLKSLDLDFTPITDAGFAHVLAMANLEGLNISCTGISETGLGRVRELPKLRHISISVPVNDRVTEHLKSLPNLTSLFVSGQPNDDCLARLETLPRLTEFTLQFSQVSDASVASLKGLPNLVSLSLRETPVGDAALARLHDLKAWSKLRSLSLEGTRITDACVAHLQGMSDLEAIYLARTRLSDAVIPRLLALPKLQFIDLQKTRVSANGHASLKLAFRKGDVQWSEPNRTAAQSVLALGGTVAVRPKDQKDDQLIKASADLPPEYFRLTRANLGGVQKSLDQLLPEVAALTDAEFDRLEALDLSGTTITDADLAHLESLKALAQFSLRGTKVSDEGLAHLTKLSALRELDLSATQVTAAGAVAFAKALPKCKVVHERK
jgi:Leucine-rich repeat (LRR) protein